MKHYFSALVMAGARPGRDPIAEKGGVSLKCLAPIEGRPLVEWVIESLLESQKIGQIYLSADFSDVFLGLPLTGRLIREGRVKVISTGPNLFESVARAVEEVGPGIFPFVITTADNVLQTGEMVDYFIEDVARSDADVAWAMTPRHVAEERNPEHIDMYSFHRFRGGDYSNCNLYALCNEVGMNGARIMRSGGQFRIRPWRVLREFGLINLLLYRFGLLSFKQLEVRMGRVLKARTKAVSMPFHEAPIDVDTLKSYDLASLLLARRHSPADDVDLHVA